MVPVVGLRICGVGSSPVNHLTSVMTRKGTGIIHYICVMVLHVHDDIYYAPLYLQWTSVGVTGEVLY